MFAEIVRDTIRFFARCAGCACCVHNHGHGARKPAMRMQFVGILILACAVGNEAGACAGLTENRHSVFVRIASNGDIVHEAAHGVNESLHIPGLAFVAGNGGEQARARVAAAWAGRAVTVAVVTPADRWGRVVGYVTSAKLGPATTAELAVDLLATGGYMLVPEDVPSGCRESWRKAERQALDIGAGIWGQTPSSLQPAALPEGARLGQRLVIRGRISSVGVRTARVYINFGGPGSGSATASMSPVIWRKLAERGFSPEALRGRNALVRGHVASLSPRWMLDVDNAAAVEIE